MMLRYASSSDTADIASLHANSWRIAYADVLNAEYLNHHADADRLNLWNQRLTDPAVNQRIVVLQEFDTILGFACLFLDADPQWGTLLDNLHVVASQHRKGLGTALMREVRRIACEECGSIPIHLSVIKTNVRAQCFYQSLGAEQKDEYTWPSPDGGHVPCFLYTWSTPAAIATEA